MKVLMWVGFAAFVAAMLVLNVILTVGAWRGFFS